MLMKNCKSVLRDHRQFFTRKSGYRQVSKATVPLGVTEEKIVEVGEYYQ